MLTSLAECDNVSVSAADRRKHRLMRHRYSRRHVVTTLFGQPAFASSEAPLQRLCLADGRAEPRADRRRIIAQHETSL